MLAQKVTQVVLWSKTAISETVDEPHEHLFFIFSQDL